MNILLATSITTWGGGENWMLSAALGLRDHGHQVDLIAPAGSALGRRAFAAGLPVHAAGFPRDFDPRGVWFVYRLCRRLRTDVLCLNMDRVLRVAGPAARLAGARAVVPRRGSEMPIGRKLSHRWSWSRVATGAIANSQATRDTMLASAPWLSPTKVRVIYNGISLAEYQRPDARDRLRRELGTAPATPVIGMVGELTDRKNHILLVRQLPWLRERIAGLEVWIAGAGPEQAALRAEAERLGVAGALKVLGFRRDVPDLMNAIDLLVHPALVEGFGYVLVEAMAAGKPVIAARASNIPEIVQPGQTGDLFPVNDAEAMREAVLRLLSDPEQAAALGQAGRDRVREHFSLERMIAELEAYFRGLVAGGDGPAG